MYQQETFFPSERQPGDGEASLVDEDDYEDDDDEDDEAIDGLDDDCVGGTDDGKYSIDGSKNTRLEYNSIRVEDMSSVYCRDMMMMRRRMMETQVPNQ